MKAFTHLLILSFVILFASCSEQRHCARFIRKHPACFRIDTVYRVDTLRITESKVDTFFDERVVTDTLTLENDSVVVKYIRVNHTVYLEGKSKAQTIIKKIPVKVMGPTIVKKEKYIPWYVVLLIVLLVVISIWLTLLIIRAQYFKHLDSFR